LAFIALAANYSLVMFILMPQRENTGAGFLHPKRHILVGDQTICHYKAFDHQHLGEINQSVNQLQSSFK
jgi:N-acetyl-gamma-glutamyl-phosphate reductase